MKKKLYYFIAIVYVSMFSWQVSAQLSEDFETAQPPADWAVFIGENGEGTTQNWVDNSTGNAGSAHAMRVRYESVATSAEDWLVTGLVDLSTTTNAELRFFTRQSYGSDYGNTYEVRVSTMSQTTHADFTSIISYTELTLNSSTTVYEEKIVDLSMYDGQSIYIAFVMTNDGGDNWYIDDVSVAAAPSCTAPLDILTTNLLPNSIDISWTDAAASAWEYVVQAAGTGAPTTAGTSVATTSANVTGLMAQTDYEVYVRAICGVSDQSTWTGPTNFTTPCATEVPDYIEDFTTYLNPCWRESTGPITGPTGGTTSGWVADGFANNGSAGSARFNIYSTGGDDWLLTPVFDLSAGGYEINLDVALTSFIGTTSQTIGDDDAVYVMQSIDGGTTWTTLYTWDGANSPSNTGDNVTIDISAVTSATTQFAIYALEGTVSGGDMNIYVDNFQVRTPPSCLSPTALATANVTANGVDLSWADAIATAWEYVVQAAGTGVPTAAGTSVATTSANVTGLMAQTDYEVYVRAICGVSDQSAWIGPTNFTTPCPTEVPDYIEDFTTYLNPCWSESTGPITGPTGGPTSSWLADGFANNGSTGSARFNIYGTGGDDWLLTPVFDLSAGGYEINLDVALTSFSGTTSQTIGDDDAVYVMQSIDGGTTWTIIYTWDGANSPSNTGDNVTIDVSTVTSATTQFAIYALEGSVSGGDMNIYVDNFQVRTPPSCLSPTALATENVTVNGVDLSWTNGDTESAWNVEYMPTGDAQGTGTVVAVNANPYTLAGLTEGTIYDFYVQADCGGDVSAWAGPFSWNQLMPPANDLCSGALPIVCGDSLTGTTVVAASEPSLSGCTTAVNTAPGVWYSLVGDGLEMTVNTDSSSFDTKMGLYSGTCDALVCVATNDDGGEGARSQITFTGNAGETYYVYVTGYSSNAGDYQLNLMCTDLNDPDGDGVDNATDNCPNTANADQADLDNDGIGDVCDDDADGDGVPGTLDCNDMDATITTQPGDSCDDGDAATINDVLDASCVCAGVIPPPANDVCSTATDVTGGATLVGETTVAATDNGDALGCTQGAGVWYEYTGDGSTVTVAISNVGTDLQIAIASSSDCTNFTGVSCTDSSTGDETAPSFIAEVGTTYYFYIGHWSNTSTSTGDFDLTVTSVMPVMGCMDANACNYDELATVDDGSCILIGDDCVINDLPGTVIACDGIPICEANAVPTITVPADITISCDVAVPVTTAITENFCTNLTVTSADVTTGTCPMIITRTFTTNDDCGNVLTAVQTITVVDNTAPDLIINGDATVQCMVDVPAQDYLVEDNCDANPTVTVDETSVGTACSMTITRTYTATDACGNQTVMMEVITVADTTAPELILNGDASVQCIADVPAQDYLVSDNCDASPAVVVNEVVSDGTCPMTITRTYTATDACSNTTTSVEVITVNDTEAPTIIAPDPITVECGEVIPEGEYLAEDNCDANPSVAFTDATLPSDMGCGYSILRTYTVTDACGNSSTEVQVITVEDTTAPILAAVPADVTVACDAVPTAPAVIATDNCDDNVSVSMSETIVGTECPYTITRTWTATDVCGNSVSASQTIMVSAPAAVLGCTDANACNYDMNANQDDNSCYFMGDSCDDGDATTENDVYTDCNTCAGTTIVVLGCTDANACNYDMNANQDDNSCYFMGDSCDDGDATTENDVYTDCNTCAGSPVGAGVQPGDIVITEIMKNPAAVADAAGEWIELYNTTAADIDMENMVVSDLGVNTFTIHNLVIPANSYIVLAKEIDVLVNGGVVADYDYPNTFALGNGSDEVVLSLADGTLIDQVVYTDATFPDDAGASMSLNPNMLNATANDNGANWCSASTSYGDGDLGTPGALNDSCGGGFDCPILEANIGDACDDGNPFTTGDAVMMNCECAGTQVNCMAIVPTIWSSNGSTFAAGYSNYNTFVAGSTNDVVQATSADGNVSIELFDGACGGTSMGVFDAYTAVGSMESAVTGELVPGNTYSFILTSDAPITSVKVKTFAPTLFNAHICDTLVMGDQIRASRDFEMYGYGNTANVNGYSYLFVDQVDGTIIELDDLALDGFYQSLYEIPGLMIGHSYDVSVRHRVNQSANGNNLDLWSEYSTAACPLVIDGTVPTTQVRDEFCGLTDYGFSSALSAVNIPGASTYTWSFTDQADGMEYLYTDFNGYAMYLYEADGLQLGHTYDVKVKATISGVMGDYGPSCVIGLSGTVATTKVRDTSCGNDYIYPSYSGVLADVVSSASEYTWEFTEGGVSHEYVTSSYIFLTYQWWQPQLYAGTWSVRVKAQVDGVYGAYGASCDINLIDPNMGALANSSSVIDGGVNAKLSVYPNPNSGELVRLNVDGLTSGNHVSIVRVLDMYGKQVYSEQFYHKGEVFNGAIELRSDLPVGLYLVHMVVDGKQTSQRLIIE